MHRYYNDDMLGATGFVRDIAFHRNLMVTFGYKGPMNVHLGIEF